MTDALATDPDLESATAVAEAMANYSSDEDGQMPGWDDLPEEIRENFIELSRLAIRTFVEWATAKGMRIIPAGVAPIPQSDEEAAAMHTAVRSYIQAKRRKPGLIGSVSPGLVLPGKLNGKAH